MMLRIRAPNSSKYRSTIPFGIVKMNKQKIIRKTIKTNLWIAKIQK